MRCPACNADNPDDAPRCGQCNARLGRRPRRRDEDDTSSDTPFSPQALARNPLGVAAYRCAVYALIPVVGLLLGPVALGLGIAAWLRTRRDPTSKRSGHARAAMVLGSLLMITNWVGLALMWLGLSER